MYRVIKAIERSLSFLKINRGLAYEVEKAGLPPGTKRTWGGKDFIKGQDGKWNHAPKQKQGKEAPAETEKPSGVSKPVGGDYGSHTKAVADIDKLIDANHKERDAYAQSLKKIKWGDLSEEDFRKQLASTQSKYDEFEKKSNDLYLKRHAHVTDHKKEQEGGGKDSIKDSIDKKGFYKKPAGTSPGQAQVDQAGRNKQSQGAPIDDENNLEDDYTGLTDKEIVDVAETKAMQMLGGTKALTTPEGRKKWSELSDKLAKRAMALSKNKGKPSSELKNDDLGFSAQKNPFNLYDDHKGYEKAHNEILNHMKKTVDSGKSVDEVLRFAKNYGHVGANDTASEEAIVETYNKMIKQRNPEAYAQMKKKERNEKQNESRSNARIDSLADQYEKLKSQKKPGGIRPSVQIKDGKVTDNRRPDSIRTQAFDPKKPKQSVINDYDNSRDLINAYEAEPNLSPEQKKRLQGLRDKVKSIDDQYPDLNGKSPVDARSESDRKDIDQPPSNAYMRNRGKGIPD